MLSLKLKTVRVSVTRSMNKLETKCSDIDLDREAVKRFMKEMQNNKLRLLDLHKEREVELERFLAESDDENKDCLLYTSPSPRD